MSNLIIQEDGAARTRPPENGEEITVLAPCNCTSVTGVSINGTAYPFYDASGNCVSGESGLFTSGSLIRVLIDTNLNRAQILNLPTSGKQNTITASGILKGNGAGGISTGDDTDLGLSSGTKTAYGLTSGSAATVFDKLKTSLQCVRTPIPLNDLAIGDTITLNETVSGVTSAVEFWIASKNYQSTGRALLLRKTPVTGIAYGTTSTYADSNLDTFCRTTYLSRLSTYVQSQIENVPIPVSTTSTIQRKSFVLSQGELGLTGNMATSTYTVFGSMLPLFNSGIPIEFPSHSVWTRTPRTDITSCAITAYGRGVSTSYPNGYLGSAAVSSSGSYTMPAFTLPLTFAAEYTDSFQDILGNAVTLPGVKIATGSYTGTGTYGSSHPNSLTFDFVPKLLFISHFVNDTRYQGLASYNAVIPIDPSLVSAKYFTSTSQGSYGINFMTLSNANKTVSWYITTNGSNSDAYGQLNATGTWVFVALG